MGRSPDSPVPSADGQPPVGKWDDKASARRQGGEANPRAAKKVNAVSASSSPPAIKPIQLELFPGRAGPLTAKPATGREEAKKAPTRRDGVEGGGTRGERTGVTGETLFGPAWEVPRPVASGREADKGGPRNRRNDAGQGVGGGRSTDEPRENRGEGRAAASTARPKRGKTAGLPPRGKATPRPKAAEPKRPERLDKVRKLQRSLYRTAKSQPERRFTLLYDKVCRHDVLWEAWRRVASRGGAAGADDVAIEEVKEYGAERFVRELEQELVCGTYRASAVRRVHIPKPGQPGKTRPLGIPTVKDRVVQMAVKLVIEPLFEADFRPCSYGFRPKKATRMALKEIHEGLSGGFEHVVDVDLKSYFDTIDHDLLMERVSRRVEDVQVLRLIRAWLKAGVLEEGRIRHPDRGSPQGGVISPLLSNIMLHEVDRRWCDASGKAQAGARLIRYADDMVLLARTEGEARGAWELLQAQFRELHLVVNQEKSRLTTAREGFTFLGFDFRRNRDTVYLWPCAKACKNIGRRIREVVRSHPNSERLDVVVQKLNPVLWGWCTYFRIGNSNRVFHKVDHAARRELQLWLRRKHRCPWRTAMRRWGYRLLHERCRLYRMVGKVSYWADAG
jgi:RNA-directed DNA polymerase